MRPYGRISDYAWSPDGAHLAFSMEDRNGFDSLHLWSASDGKLRRLTDEMFNESSPGLGPGGQVPLLPLGSRVRAADLDVEWNFAGNRTTGIFALALRKDVKHPFPPRSDEVTTGERRRGQGQETGRGRRRQRRRRTRRRTTPKPAAKKPVEPVRIDFDGLASRVARVPVEADNIDGLAATKGFLLYRTSGAPFYGRDSYEKTKLRIFDFKEREATVLVDRWTPSASRTTGRRSSSARAASSTSTTPSRRPRTPRRSRHRASPSIACRPRSGRRSSTRSGAATATSSTSATCTATTGRRSASGTARCCRTSPTAPT